MAVVRHDRLDIELSLVPVGEVSGSGLPRLPNVPMEILVAFRKQWKHRFHGLPILGIVAKVTGDILGVKDTVQTGVVGCEGKSDMVLLIRPVYCTVQLLEVENASLDVVGGTLGLFDPELARQFNLGSRHDLHKSKRPPMTDRICTEPRFLPHNGHYQAPVKIVCARVLPDGFAIALKGPLSSMVQIDRWGIKLRPGEERVMVIGSPSQR